MAVIRFSHHSRVLSSLMECNIVLPDVVFEAAGVNKGTPEAEKLKVLWLCHGGSGDQNEWLYHADLIELSNRYHIGIVLVNANDSCFVDMPYGLRYGTYLGEELPRIVRNTFSLFSSAREDNLISGLSNGGYGCFYLGLKYPENYAAIGAFSAGDKADAVPKPFQEGQMNPRVRMFGAVDIHHTEYSIKHLARELAKTERVKPKIYHACGGKDPWLSMNLLVKQCFEEIDNADYAYVYHQMDEYGHEWKFWEQELNNFLANMI